MAHIREIFSATNLNINIGVSGLILSTIRNNTALLLTMASISSLPTELLLQIFEKPCLSISDLICIHGVCSRWRDILQAHKRTQQLLRLRPFPSPKGRCYYEPESRYYYCFDIIIERVPATIWNDYEESWAMIWRNMEITLDMECGENPLFENWPHILKLINPNFKNCTMKGREGDVVIEFKNVDELRRLTAVSIDDKDIKWRQMLLANQHIRRLCGTFNLGVRYHGRKSYRWFSHGSDYSRKKKAGIKMGHFVDEFRRYIRELGERLCEYKGQLVLYS